MRNSLLSLAVLSVFTLPAISHADEAAPEATVAAAPASPHTFAYNVGSVSYTHLNF